MKSLLILLLIVTGPVLLGQSCTNCKNKQAEMQAVADNANEEKPCLCPKNFKPVCADDGKTYSNECSATCASVKVLAEGPCLKEMAK